MKRPLARFLALLLGLLALVTASGGCEAIVTGVVPSSGCAPGEGACAPGQVCSPTGECIAACPDVPCPDPTVCVNSLCVDPPARTDSGMVDAPRVDATLPPTDAQLDTRPPRDVGGDTPAALGDIGAKCAIHANCISGLCGDTSVVTGAVIQAAGGPVCTKTCCRSEDCPTGSVCFGPGGGGNYCVKAALLPRGDGGTLGAAAGGAACATGNTCRSGVCINSVCADACCTHADCGSALCRRETVDGHQVHACGKPPVAPVADGVSCASSAECASGFCIDAGGGFFCRPRCCNQKACTSNPAFFATSLCNYVPAQPTTENLTGCFTKSEVGAGTKSVGDTTCTQDSDCKTNICALGTPRMCTDVCCTDQDCALYPKALRCRPAPGPNFYLLCQP